MLLNLIRLIFILLITFDVNAQGSLQNSDFKTVGQLQAQGLTEEQAKAQMLHDTKVYVTTDGINKLLSEAITDGDIGGGVDELTTDGDLLYYNSGLDRLGIGLEGQILQVSSLGFPEWADAPSVSPTTTEGDLIIRGDTEDVRLPIGTAGKILTSNGTTATWEDAPISLPDQTSQGGKVLTTNGTSASWVDVDDRTNVIKNNLLTCANFDGCGSSEWVIVTDATFNSTGTSTRTDEVAANNVNFLSISGIPIPAADYNIKATATKTANFSGQQMLAFCEVKTLRANTFFIVGANATEQSRREVINDGKWRYYEIPFIGGDTSQYIEINSETTASQDVISVDNCFMGKVSPDYFARISGAQYVGGLTAQGANNCQWSVTSTTFANFPVDNDCNTFTSNGNIKAPSTKIPGFIIPAGSPIGTYTVNAKINAGVSSSNTAACLYRLSSHSFDSKTDSLFTSTSSSNLQATFGTYYIKLTDSSTDTLFQVQSRATSGSCSLIHTNAFLNFGFDVYYYPDSTNTIVTQNTELTAQSANEFVANVSATGVVSGENFDWINGNCSNTSTGNYTCNFNSGIFEAQPVCQASLSGDGREINSTETVLGITIASRSSGGTLVNYPFALKCTRSTDYRKHATIVGKFSNLGTPSAETLKLTSIPTYTDDASAGTGGLVSGDVYKTATGELRIKL
jgi:hypothetical protein